MLKFGGIVGGGQKVGQIKQQFYFISLLEW
jgi:hypothetical protein